METRQCLGEKGKEYKVVSLPMRDGNDEFEPDKIDFLKGC